MNVSQIRKTIVAAITAIGALGALAVDGYDTEEVYAAAAIVLGVLLVYFTPNDITESQKEDLANDPTVPVGADGQPIDSAPTPEHEDGVDTPDSQGQEDPDQGTVF